LGAKIDIFHFTSEKKILKIMPNLMYFLLSLLYFGWKIENNLKIATLKEKIASLMFFLVSLIFFVKNVCKEMKYEVNLRFFIR
jgi:hypothetical protein